MTHQVYYLHEHPECSQCSLLYLDPQQVSVVIIPPVDDELLQHLKQSLLDDATLDKIKEEIDNYLTVKQDDIKSIQYRIFAIVDNNDYDTNDGEIDNPDIPDNTEGLITVDDIKGYLNIAVSPPIDDDGLRDCVFDLLEDKMFISKALEMSNKELSSHLEGVISDYQTRMTS